MKKKLYKLPKAKFIRLRECVLQSDSVIRGGGRNTPPADQEDPSTPTGVNNGNSGWDF